VADLIKRVPFERPSLPQTAPLGKVPLGLLEVSGFYAAWSSQAQSFVATQRYRGFSEWLTQPDNTPIEWWGFLIKEALSARHVSIKQLANSFRSRDRDKLSLYQHLTQPDFAWVSEALGLNFDVTIAVGARQQLLDSVRAQDKKPDYNQLLYHHKSFAVLFTKPADIVGALQQLTGSFRTTLEGVKLDVRGYQWGQEISYIVPLELTGNLFQGMTQYRDSRRR